MTTTPPAQPPVGPPKRKTPLYLALGAIVVVVIAVAGFLWLGGGDDKSERITVAATQVPHAEILEFIKNGPAKDAGLDFDIRVFDDYSLGNRWLSEGDIDANYFQHKPYLEEQVADFGYQLHEFPGVHIEPYAAFSDKITSAEQLPDGARISITDDGSNQARALKLLETKGLVTLPTDGPVNVKTVGNPKNLQFIEAAPDLQAKAVPDVDLAILNGNYFLDAGYTLKDALIVESTDNNPYANFLASRQDNADDPNIVKLNELLHSPQTKEFIEQRWPGGDVYPAF
ncbi:MetQ/NlpA family ABC transporter substrate-binding protein [Mycolicibacterium sp. BiH015]|uniref:MetQ/NlpA family ABC transporter substrate-binding protein n=1 Tax=Mycolicibacterium sp. BiH015 TaxID=3018808 RepID=UPI0022E97250|nr:MetQ/NlpA family ABC transporter substrate-binding protein [Mycolicibacterium sp. BiH015]MDA2890196.1 MetQ/NlpA family ABC transporter substrate-binding protein [Mycolicibacterium sp. BiH015]